MRGDEVVAFADGTVLDELPDVGDLGLTTRVNGELRQDGSTSDLIFGPDDRAAGQ